MVQLCLRWFNFVFFGSTLSSVVRICLRWFNFVFFGSTWSLVIQLGLRWFNLVFGGSTQSSVVQLSLRWFNLVFGGLNQSTCLTQSTQFNLAYVVQLLLAVNTILFQVLQKHGSGQKLARFEIPQAVFLVRFYRKLNEKIKTFSC